MQLRIPNYKFLIPQIEYFLFLGDSNLILSQRNAEWCGHGPVLEQDIAITNISLDLIGQARNFYQYAATLINQQQNESKTNSQFPIPNSNTSQPNSQFPIPNSKSNSSQPNSQFPIPNSSTTEDTLAYHRDVRDFKNLLLVEQPNGDWAQTILRQFFFSNYQYHLLQALQQSADEQVAAIANKSFKEVSYHLRWSSEWVVRLGDGTEESRRRILEAIELLWPFTGEMFTPAGYELEVSRSGIGVDPSTLKKAWYENLRSVFEEAKLTVPKDAWSQNGGKSGTHSEHLGYILAELQFMQRAYPGNEW